MNPSAWLNDRRLVPRWRSLTRTLKSRELADPIKRDAKVEDSQDFLSRLELWGLAPNLVTAAELVETCIVEGRERDAVDAARRLVAIDKNAAPLIRQQAGGLLIRMGHRREVPADICPIIDQNVRTPIRLHLRDPLAWVELSLTQTVSGSSVSAQRSMIVALSLAPNNRHVLRSAARLFLHCEDPERALAIIARSAASRSDTWLMASEIALAQVADKPSKFLKSATNILSNGGIEPRQITELAGAVATEELVHGNRKKSRRCFAQSMIDPTGSALAQGEWATPSLGRDLIEEDRLTSAFENSEAMAFHLYRLRRLKDVPQACNDWSEEDPFSIRPFEFATAAASYIEDFETALAFAQRGLKIRPASPSLLNSFAFSSASMGAISEAEAALAKIRHSESDKHQQLISTANRGLIAYRRGDQNAGKALYLQAVDGFRRIGSYELAARAKVYLAREAMIASAVDWPALLADAKHAMAKHKDSEGMVSLALVEEQAKEIGSKIPIAPPNDEHIALPKPTGISVAVKFRLPEK